MHSTSQYQPVSIFSFNVRVYRQAANHPQKQQANENQGAIDSMRHSSDAFRRNHQAGTETSLLAHKLIGHLTTCSSPHCFGFPVSRERPCRLFILIAIGPPVRVSNLEQCRGWHRQREVTARASRRERAFTSTSGRGVTTGVCRRCRIAFASCRFNLSRTMA